MKLSKRKKEARLKYAAQWKRGRKSSCPACGEPGPHLVPPSLGESAFFICVEEPKDKDLLEDALHVRVEYRKGG